jgi:hypothetical protein
MIFCSQLSAISARNSVMVQEHHANLFLSWYAKRQNAVGPWSWMLLWRGPLRLSSLPPSEGYHHQTRIVVAFPQNSKNGIVDLFWALSKIQHEIGLRRNFTLYEGHSSLSLAPPFDNCQEHTQRAGEFLPNSKKQKKHQVGLFPVFSVIQAHCRTRKLEPAQEGSFSPLSGPPV